MSLFEFISGVVIAYIAVILLTLFANPNYIKDQVTRESEIEKVDDRQWRSAGFLAIVVTIFAISIVQSHGTPLANTALVLSAGFSMLSFVSSSIAKIRKIFLRVQSEAYKFAIFSLIFSLYFIAQSIGISADVNTIFFAFLVVIFSLYTVFFLFYVYRTYTEFNDNSNIGRYEWLKRNWRIWREND